MNFWVNYCPTWHYQVWNVLFFSNIRLLLLLKFDMSSWSTSYLRFKNFKGPIWQGRRNVAYQILSMISLIYIWFILTYPIDFIGLDFVVNRGRYQHNCRTPVQWDPQYFFTLNFYLNWKFYLSSLSGLKFWRICWRRTLQLWHLVIFYSPVLIVSFFYSYLFWKFHVFSLNGWKVWILKDLTEYSPILVPQTLAILSFLDICLTWKFDVPSLKVWILATPCGKDPPFWHP